MELSQLEYFRVLGRLQHVTRAAEELDIAQPTLSRAISRLEAELGVALFAPLGRSVELSPYGITFLAFVERSLDELRNGRLRLLEQSSADGSTIALGFSRSLGPRFVPDLTRRFRLEHPHVRFLFTDDYRDRLNAQLLDGQIALCITERIDDPRVEWRRVAHQNFIVIVPPDHRLAGRTTVALADLAGEPLVTFKERYRLRKKIDALLRTAGVEVTIVSESDDSALVHAQVANGSGIAIVPSSGEKDDVVSLMLDDPIAGRDIGMSWLLDRRLSATECDFRAFVIEQALRTPGLNERATPI